MSTDPNHGLEAGPKSAGPRFCQRCHARPKSAEATVCEHCGDRLIPLGYCPVCEDYLQLPVGRHCPKHDLPLEAERPLPEMARDAKAARWVTLAQFSDSLAAEAPRIRLEAEGIPTFVEGERMGGRSMYHVATGGVKLKVPDHLASDARIILSQTWSDTKARLDIEDEWDDYTETDELPPSPYEDIEKTAEIPPEPAALRHDLLVLLVLGLPALLLLYMLLEYYRTF